MKEASASEENTETRRVNNWQGHETRAEETPIDKTDTADGEGRDGGTPKEKKGEGAQQRLGSSPLDATMDGN